MTHTNDATPAGAESAAAAARHDDVHGFGLDDIIGTLVPSLPTPPPPSPSGGDAITGWPDPVPPVVDPATVAAWKGPKAEPPGQ